MNIAAELNNLSRELTLYHNDVLEAVDSGIRRAANEGRVLLKSLAPKNVSSPESRKKYADSFYITYYRDYSSVGAVLRSSQWQLTHLLEDGHLTRNGTSKTKPLPHWEPGGEHITALADKYVMEAINQV